MRISLSGDDLPGDSLYLYDALPGIGIVSWAIDSPTPDRARCAIAKYNAPDPSQSTLECSIAALGCNETRAVTVTSIAPLEPGCLALANEAYAHFPPPRRSLMRICVRRAPALPIIWSRACAKPG